MKRELNSEPLFFLFTCVKDGREYIENLFQSLINQTKINFCHYIYDDGSAEPMDDLIQEYKENVSKLRTPYKIIYERNPKNIGLNLATRHCISKCNCDYFIWINCDDFIDSHFFEEMEKYALTHKRCSVIRSNLFDAISRKEIEKDAFRRKQRKNKYQLKNFLYGLMSWSFFAVKLDDYFRINPQNIIYNKKGFFNDEQILLTCAVNSLKMGFASKAIGYFLKHGDNESLKNKIANLRERYSNYYLVVQRYNLQLANSLYSILNLRVLFNEMENNIKYNTNLSTENYKKIKEIIKKDKIPLFYRYRYGNSFYWHLKLCLAKILTKIKK